MAVRPSASSSSDIDSGRVHVPQMVTDPVWSLQPWPIIVTMAGRDIEVPARPASEWLAVLMTNDLDPEAIFPGLAASVDQVDFVEDSLFDGIVELDDLYRTCLDVISLASGRPWYITLRIIGYAAGAWDVIGGELAYRHIDAGQLSLAAWLDATLLTLLRNMEKEKITMFLSTLEAAPPGMEGETKEPEMSADQFLAMAD